MKCNDGVKKLFGGNRNAERRGYLEMTQHCGVTYS